MSARRNSPRIDQLGTAGATLARAAMNRMPSAPAQSEMRGMETSAAATILAAEQRGQAQKRAKASSKEDLFDFQLRSYDLPPFERQFKFAESVGRKFRADFSNQRYMLMIEIEGLIVQRVHIATIVNGRVVKTTPELICRGRHASISGFRDDCEKYAIAGQLGWTVLRFEQSQVKDGTAIEHTQRVLASKGWSR